MKRKLLTKLVLNCILFSGITFLFLQSNNSKGALNAYVLETLSGVALDDTLSTTQLLGTVDNIASTINAIGFNFVLNGTTYTHFSVNDNGLIRLATSSVGLVVSNSSSNSITANSDFPKLTAYWDDLRTQTGTVRFKSTGVSPNKKLMIQWNVTLKNASNQINAKFQVWLFEGSNTVQFVYGQNLIAAPSGSYSVGMSTSTSDYICGTVTPSFLSSTVSSSSVFDGNTAAIASGSSMRFTLAPGCATLTAPANNTTNLQPNALNLTWTAGTGTTTGYNVYFGTLASPPIVSTNQAGTTYNTGALLPNTQYYWRAVARNGNALAANCTTNFTFSTAGPPGCPNIVSPAANAVGVTYNNDTLKWSAGTGTTTSYDVYFGTDPVNPLSVSTGQVGTFYVAGNLLPNTTYYWKIIGKNGTIPSTGCNIVSFTTASKLNFDVTRSTGVTFTSIASSGTIVPGWRNGNNTDDNLSNAVSIGFPFNYANTNYSNVLISTNGYITFNTATTALGNGNRPYGYDDSALANYFNPASILLVAPFYYDIVCQGNSQQASGLSGSIRYSTTGSVGSRVFTVEWSGMELFINAGPNLNFQVKLYESSNVIEFVYGVMEGFNGTFARNYSYSVGLNAATHSNPMQTGEAFNQMTSNTRDFGLTPNTQQNIIPECNSRLQFTPGNYSPYVPVSMVPPNDNVGGAITLPVNAAPCIDQCGTIYTSANATNSGISGCSFTNADDDVWFSFTAAANPSTTIKVLPAGNYDATIELFTSSGGVLGSTLACANAANASFTEMISMNLMPGQLYFVRVFHRQVGWNAANSSGQFSICVSATPPPPANDECANAINLNVTATPNYIPGTSTYSGTPSSGIPMCAQVGTNPDDDVWYTFTALNTTEIISVVGHTGYDAVVQLFSGACGTLNSINCIDNLHNGQTETLTATGLTRNAVYRVRVFHGGTGGGTGAYDIAVYSPTPNCVTVMIPANTEPDLSVAGVDLAWDSVPGADSYKVYLDTINPPTRLISTTPDQLISSGLLAGGKTYYWFVSPGNATGYTNNCQIFEFYTEQTPYTVRVQLFLEGLYNGNHSMKPLINPLDTLVDTVTISLVDSSLEVVFSSNALLSTHGWATAYFPAGAGDDYYYILIDHRNCLESWSPDFVHIYGPDTTIIFCNSAASILGSNQVQVEPGLWALHTGDFNKDGTIDYLDMIQLQQSVGAFMSGWFTEDFNGDYYVESIDCSLLENKIALGVSAIRP